MQKDVVLGFVRHALTFLGGYIMSQTGIDPTDYASLIGSLISLVGIIWSIYDKKKGTE